MGWIILQRYEKYYKLVHGVVDALLSLQRPEIIPDFLLETIQDCLQRLCKPVQNGTWLNVLTS